MKNYRIQLASNYQVIEFNLQIEDEERISIDHPEIEDAIELVNALGRRVEQAAKSPASKKAPKEEVKKKAPPSRNKDDLATENQIDYLLSLGYDGDDIYELTKKEANERIRKWRDG